jgi:hypothetical protein
MNLSAGAQVEVVVINWKRPENVATIVQALHDQTAPCTITICDCHDSPEFELPMEALSTADRVYRWEHNLGSFNRYVPLGAYDHRYTFFFDDDMVPGPRCVEHFLACAADLQAFGALGQLGRIVDADGAYRSGADIARSRGFTEVDILVRALFVPTSCLVHAPQARAVLQAGKEPDEDILMADDILMAVGLAIYAGLGCYLTPVDPDPATLINMHELPSPYAVSHRPTHDQSRSRLTRRAVRLGWSPLRMRRQLAEESGTPDADRAGSRGVLYLALGTGYRYLTLASISALRRYGYRGPIRVVTDDEGWVPPALNCEAIVVPDVGDGYSTRYYKTRLLEFAYDLTLYLDSDAIPIADIDDVWSCLRDCDIAMAADARQTVGALIAGDRHIEERRAEFGLMMRLGLTSRVYFNSGVMVFRRSSTTAAVFASWHEEWLRFRNRDQLALVRAVALTDTPVGSLPPAWNCPPIPVRADGRLNSRSFASIRDARDSGVKVLHFLSYSRSLMTAQLVSALADLDRYPADGDWEERDLLGGQFLAATNRNPPDGASIRRSGGGFLVRAVNGSAEHFEMVLPAAGGGVECYWRECSAADHSWSELDTVGRSLGPVESATVVSSTRGSQPTIELVARVGPELAHYWRASGPNSAWQGPEWLAAGATGNPSLIRNGHGAADPQHGSLELVVPLAAGGIARYWRDAASADPYWSGPAVFATELGQVDAVVLAESIQGAEVNFEVLVRKGGQLAHYRQPADDRLTWLGPAFFFDDATGIPGFIGGGAGEPTTLQILVPLAHGGIAHLWRSAGSDWQISSCIDRGGAHVDAVSLVAARSHSPGGPDLEAVAVSGDDIAWYRRKHGLFGNWTRVLL